MVLVASDFVAKSLMHTVIMKIFWLEIIWEACMSNAFSAVKVAILIPIPEDF